MTTTPTLDAIPARTPRPLRTGYVSSHACDQSITVVLDYTVRHPKYGKFIKRRTKLHAHDPQNAAKVGDLVEIMQTRPISKTKHWRLVRVVRRAEE